MKSTETTETNETTKTEKGAEKTPSPANIITSPKDQHSGVTGQLLGLDRLAEGKLQGDALAAQLQSQLGTRQGGEVVSAPILNPESSMKPQALLSGYQEVLVSNLKNPGTEQDQSAYSLPMLPHEMEDIIVSAAKDSSGGPNKPEAVAIKEALISGVKKPDQDGTTAKSSGIYDALISGVKSNNNQDDSSDKVMYDLKKSRP
jgi:hypothetical protein